MAHRGDVAAEISDLDLQAAASVVSLQVGAVGVSAIDRREDGEELRQDADAGVWGDGLANPTLARQDAEMARDRDDIDS